MSTYAQKRQDQEAGACFKCHKAGHKEAGGHIAMILQVHRIVLAHAVLRPHWEPYYSKLITSWAATTTKQSQLC